MNCKLRHTEYSFAMTTTMLFPTRTIASTTRRTSKPTQYYEHYVETIVPTQRSRQYLTTRYYLHTHRGTYYNETSDIFTDPNYYYYHTNVDNTTQWF